jgi:hypothetical protein
MQDSLLSLRTHRVHGRKSLHFNFDVLHDLQADAALVRKAIRRIFRISLEFIIKVSDEFIAPAPHDICCRILNDVSALIIGSLRE